jgi:uncharacterized protein (DUF1919 family)
MKLKKYDMEDIHQQLHEEFINSEDFIKFLKEMEFYLEI